MTQFLEQLKAHAIAHYNEDAWDVIVECYTDHELAALVGRASTLQGAIRKCLAVTKPIAERRAEHAAEAALGM
jgi:hypothetical protein|tara:strand:- start:366 stop:584 length:219 start_codon:yes stop_codon:yes gene_type:complete